MKFLQNFHFHSDLVPWLIKSAWIEQDSGKMKKRKCPTILKIFTLFAFLTIIMTYPIALRIGSSVRDLGDPLLNTWILSWDINQILHLNIQGFFQANIFYPNTRVLSYSEHLFPIALLGLPVYWLSQNPILVHNFSLLFAFTMNGVGMYLLAYHLSSHRLGSTLAGIVYSFSPFMFYHLSHLQVISAWAIPLCFLFLERWLKSESFKDLFFFTTFYLVQILSSGYYAIYLTLFLGLLLLQEILVKKKYAEVRFLAQMGIFFTSILLLAGPFFYQYYAMMKETGFVRNCDFWADLTSYLATSPINVMYGNLTSQFFKPEGALFPGIFAVFAAIIGLFPLWKESMIGLLRQEPTEKNRWSWVYNGAVLVLLSSSFLIFLTGGFKGSIGGVFISAQGPERPLIYAGILFVLRFAFDKTFRQKVSFRFPAYKTHPDLFRYSIMGLFAFFFTLGPKIHFMGKEIYSYGPYQILYDYFPGFEGLRVSSRFFIFVIFSMGIFAALGLKTMEGYWGKNKGRIISYLIIILTLIEYLSTPIPLSEVPVKESIPMIYQWLSGQKNAKKIIELPLPFRKQDTALVECPRVYFSTYHWKKIFNGFSGYIPSNYEEMRKDIQDTPLKETLLKFRKLNLDYIIFHPNEYDPEVWLKIQKELLFLKEDINFVGRFGDALVYQLRIISKMGQFKPRSVDGR